MDDTISMPHSREDEMAALGCMMQSPAIAVELLATLGGTDFYQPKHELVFAAIGRIIAAGEPLEPLAVLAALGSDATRVGGADYLHDCLSSAPSALSGPYYAGRVAEHATRRRLITAAAKIQVAASQPDSDLSTLVDESEQGILDITRYGRRGEPDTHLPVVGDAALDRLRQRMLTGDDPGIPTGLRDYDRLITHRPGQMIVFGARPGMGKSTLTQQIAINAARLGKQTMIISTEMTKDDMALRVVSDLATVDSRDLDRADLTPADLLRIDLVQRQWRQWPLHLIDHCRTWPAIRNTIRRHVARHGHIDLFVIDYLQRITPTDGEHRNDNRNLVVGRWADEIKTLALETGAVAIVASQLRREAIGQTKPTMSDLRESGQIEQSADVVALLHRYDYYNPEDRPGQAELIIAKHRRGATDTLALTAELEYSRFTG